jgi:hypothetical protein
LSARGVAAIKLQSADIPEDPDMTDTTAAGLPPADWAQHMNAAAPIDDDFCFFSKNLHAGRRRSETADLRQSLALHVLLNLSGVFIARFEKIKHELLKILSPTLRSRS